MKWKKGRASNFQDLLQGTPGIFLQSDNGVEATKISIRGSGIESEDEPLGVNFLLDGLTLNQGDGEAILEDFDVGTLKYAEIYRGADAFKYGAITLGGAVNLVPFTGYDASPFQIRLEGGSYGFMRGQASSGGVAGPLDYFASITGRYRDGFREHSRENSQIFSANLGYKLNDFWENRFYLTLDRADRQLPGGLTKDEMNDDPRQADPEALELDYNKKWEMARLADKLSYERNGARLDIGLFWFYRNMEERGFFEPDYREGITAFHSDNYGANVNSITAGELFGRRNVLTMGVSPALETEYTHNYENLDGERGAVTAHNTGISINVPLYFENQLYLTEKFSVLAGGQLIYAQRHFIDKFLTDDDGDQSHLQNFYGWNPKAGMIYAFNDDSQIFMNFSGSWQPPSFDNMSEFEEGANSSIVYKPLRPQRAWTVELGTRGEHGRFDWDLALYHSWLHNELLSLNDALGNDLGAVNIPHSLHRGIEAGFNAELWNSKKIHDETGHRFTLGQTYLLNDFHFDGDPVYSDNRLGGIPVHVYEAELIYEAPCGFYTGPNVQCNLTRYPVDQANSLNADAYALLGFKIGFRQAKGFSVFFEAKNLLDERYAAAVDPIADAQNPTDPRSFHPGDGRSFYGGVSWRW